MHINMIPWSTYPSNLLLWCGCGRWKWKQKEAQMDAIWCHMMPWMPRMDARFPEEMQHCYCGSCRKLSGAAWQSWMPIQEGLVIIFLQLDKDAKISSLYFKGNAMKIGCAKKCMLPTISCWIHASRKVNWSGQRRTGNHRECNLLDLRTTSWEQGRLKRRFG